MPGKHWGQALHLVLSSRELHVFASVPYSSCCPSINGCRGNMNAADESLWIMSNVIHLQATVFLPKLSLPPSQCSPGHRGWRPELEALTHPTALPTPLPTPQDRSLRALLEKSSMTSYEDKNTQEKSNSEIHFSPQKKFCKFWKSIICEMLSDRRLKKKKGGTFPSYYNLIIKHRRPTCKKS